MYPIHLYQSMIAGNGVSSSGGSGNGREMVAWRWRSIQRVRGMRASASLHALMAHSSPLTLLLLLLLIICGGHDAMRSDAAAAAVPNVGNKRRSPLQKYLHAERVQKYEMPFPWFLNQRHSARNTSTHCTSAYAKVRAGGRIPAAHTAGNSVESEWLSAIDADSGYLILKLDKLARKDRRRVRQILAEHSMRDAHIIDDLHVLVYIDSPRAGRLHRALEADADAPAPLSSVAVLDIYSSPAVFSLKLSRAIRIAMGRCGSEMDATFSLQQRLKLDVRTAPGRENVVEKSLHGISSKLEAARRIEGGEGKGRCRWEVLFVAAGKGMVRWLLTRSPEDHPSQGTTMACYCRDFINAVVKHPAVRWMEVAVEHAAPLNNHATALVQQGRQDGTEPFWPMWDAGINGSGEIIGIADTGIDYDSCFFDDPAETVALYPKVNYRHRKLVSVVPCELIPGDYGLGDKVKGHGTHVSGTAAGHVLGNGTMFKYDGVAKGAKLFFMGLGCPSEPLLSLPNDILDAFRPGYEAGARVFSNSWGFFVPPEYTAIEKYIDSFVIERDDSLLLFAAGNSPLRGLMTPCQAKNVMCVGGHVNSFEPDQQNMVGEFSSFGPTYDNRVKPEVVGPGKPVTSALSDGDLTTKQCSIVSKEGTSMATAAIAGAAVLIRHHLRILENVTSPSASLLKGLLIHSTVQLSNAQASGFGRVDLSVFFTPNGTKGWFRDRESVGHRGSNMYCFTVAPATTKANDWVRASLVWTDPASALEGSTHSVINDLDLVVVDSVGNVYYAGEDGKLDHANVVEQIRLVSSETLATGFRVFVYGGGVHDGVVQPHALIVSGPDLQHVTNCSALSDLTCAHNCSGNGQCIGGVCKCLPGYRFVDCSLCDEELLCHGRGTCSAEDLKCTCDNDHFADDTCSTCKVGWYGPSCSSDCTCSGSGKCNTATGECTCSRDEKWGGSGCFSGPNCEYCCIDFHGEMCNLRSYWCPQDASPVYVNDTTGAYIQINGYGTYSPMESCHWVIQAPRGYRVRLEYLQLDIEDNTDFLVVFDVISDETVELRRDTGTSAQSEILMSSYNVLTIVFASAWSQTRGGFLLHYTFEKVETPNCTLVCAQNATCDALGGGFCVCDANRAGWNCELEAPSSVATPIRLEADKTRGLARLILPINGEVHLELHDPHSTGADFHLYLAFANELLALQQQGLGLWAAVVRNSSVTGTIGVVQEGKIVIANHCRYVEISLRGAITRKDNTVNVLITLLQNASVASDMGNQANFILAEAVYTVGRGSADNLSNVRDEEETDPHHLLMYCSRTPPAGFPGRRFSNVTIMTVLLVVLVVTGVGLAVAVLSGNWRGEMGYTIEATSSDGTSLSGVSIEGASDGLGFDIESFINYGSRDDLFFSTAPVVQALVEHGEQRTLVGMREDAHAAHRSIHLDPNGDNGEEMAERTK